MCCIFTCCGWVIDVLQRFWAFSMSCCISSAVCCALFTAAMAGIALGYNYSLAEYIDTKESNVSVYLKRGVFDDEIANEMDWRRSGNALPPPETKFRGGNVEITVPTTPSADQLDFRRNMDNSQDGRRRLDDSILQSDDANKYEGSLMRLTAGLPVAVTTYSDEISSADPRLLEIADQYPRESLDQLKALQGIVNLRRGNVFPSTTPLRPPEPTFNPDQFKNIPPGILNFLPDTMRRAMQYNDLGMFPNKAKVNPLRKAVPMSMDDRDWRDPKIKDKNYFVNDDAMGVNIHPTYPRPIPENVRPARPTRPRAPAKSRVESVKGGDKQRDREDILEKSIDSELGKFKEKFMLDKFDAQRMPEEGMGDKTIRRGDDYDEEIRGLPVRRRRGELPRSRIRRDVGIKINHDDSIIIANDNYPSTPKIHAVFKTDRIDKAKSSDNILETSLKITNHYSVPILLSRFGLFNKYDNAEDIEAPKKSKKNRMLVISDITSYRRNIPSSHPDTEYNKNSDFTLNASEDTMIENTDNYPSFSTLSPGNQYDDHYPTGRYIVQRDTQLYTTRPPNSFATIASFAVTDQNNVMSLDDEMNEIENNQEIVEDHYDKIISVLNSNRKEGHLDIPFICADLNGTNYDSLTDSNKSETVANTDSYSSYRTERSVVDLLEKIENKNNAHEGLDYSLGNNDPLPTDAATDRYLTCGTVKELEMYSATESNSYETQHTEEKQTINDESDTHQNTPRASSNLEKLVKFLTFGIHF